MKKFNKQLKILIAEWNWEKSNAYYCKDHGFISKLKENDDHKCFYNCSDVEPIDNIKDLQIKFKKELKIQ